MLVCSEHGGRDHNYTIPGLTDDQIAIILSVCSVDPNDALYEFQMKKYKPSQIFNLTIMRVWRGGEIRFQRGNFVIEQFHTNMWTYVRCPE